MIKTEFDVEKDDGRLIVAEADNSENAGAAGEQRPPIFQGAKFASFAAFDRAFEDWKLAHNHPFRVASSETLRLSDGRINEHFRYRYIVYHCAHYGLPRMRGAGKRPKQNYLPCGCKAMLRLNFSWSENMLRVTTLNERHSGHDVDPESFARFSAKIRRCLSPTSSSSSSPNSNFENNNNGPPPAKRKNSAGQRVSLNATNNCQLSPLNQKENDVVPSSVFGTNTNIQSSPQMGGAAAVQLSPSTPAANLPFTIFQQALLLQQLQQQSNSIRQQQQRLQLSQLQQRQQQVANVAAATLQQQQPLDLTVDSRSDEQRFGQIHPTLQSLSDHLLSSRGSDFDAKLHIVKSMLKNWTAAAGK